MSVPSFHSAGSIFLTGCDHMEVLDVTSTSFETWHIDVMPDDELWWLKPCSHSDSREAFQAFVPEHPDPTELSNRLAVVLDFADGILTAWTD